MPIVLIADRMVETVDEEGTPLLRVLLSTTRQRAHWDLERGTVAVGSALTGVRIDVSFPDPANAGVEALSRLLAGILNAVGARLNGAGDSAPSLRLAVSWTGTDVEGAARVRVRYRGLPGGPAWAAARNAVGFGLQWPIERGSVEWDLAGGIWPALRFRGTVELDVAIPPHELTAENAHEWADALYALLLAAAGEERSASEVAAIREALFPPSEPETNSRASENGRAEVVFMAQAAWGPYDDDDDDDDDFYLDDDDDEEWWSSRPADGVTRGDQAEHAAEDEGAADDGEDDAGGDGRDVATGDEEDAPPSTPAAASGEPQPQRLVWRIPPPVTAPAPPRLNTFRPSGTAASPAPAARLPRPSAPAPVAPPLPLPLPPGARAEAPAPAPRAAAPRHMGSISSFLQPGERRALG